LRERKLTGSIICDAPLLFCLISGNFVFRLEQELQTSGLCFFALNRARQAARASNIFAGEQPLPGTQAEFVEVKKTGG